MPSSPPPCSALTWLLLLLFSFLTTTTLNGEAAAAHGCSSSSSSSCPPFTSAPPFPFSSSPGCGHPSFQIQCSSPNAIISINNLSFSLLHYEPSSYSLLLSPEIVPPPFSAGKNCSAQRSLAIPNRPISLSSSPFRVSDSSCSRISVLKPCLPPYLPNCSHCPWECKLIKDPVHLE